MIIYTRKEKIMSYVMSLNLTSILKVPYLGDDLADEKKQEEEEQKEQQQEQQQQEQQQEEEEQEVINNNSNQKSKLNKGGI